MLIKKYKKRKKKNIVRTSKLIEKLNKKTGTDLTNLHIESDIMILADVSEKITENVLLILKETFRIVLVYLDTHGNFTRRKLLLNYKKFKIKVYSQQWRKPLERAFQM